MQPVICDVTIEPDLAEGVTQVVTRHACGEHDAKGDTMSRTVVLLVEDEPLIAMYGTDILSDAGYDVVEVRSGNEAMTVLASRDDIAILFTDVVLVGTMDGLTLATMANLARPDLSIVVTSGTARPGLSDLPHEAAFIPKPYSPETLIQAVAKATRSAGS